MQTNNQAASGGLLLNPLLKQLDKVKERSDVHATYGGIFTRCMFFAIMILVGILAAVTVNMFFPILVDASGEITVPAVPAILAVVSVVAMLVFPFLAFILRKTIPVTGSIYCAFIGYAVTFMALMDESIAGVVMLALALTLIIVLVMAALFIKGIIKVTQKFRAVTTTLFTTMILGSFVMFLLSLIPGLHDAMMFLESNLLLSILFSVLGIVVAAMFLLVDFDRIQQTVEKQLPKEYEWFAAFAMIFTVIWLYFKILDLLTKLKDGK